MQTNQRHRDDLETVGPFAEARFMPERIGLLTDLLAVAANQTPLAVRAAARARGPTQ